MACQDGVHENTRGKGRIEKRAVVSRVAELCEVTHTIGWIFDRGGARRLLVL